MLPGPDEVIACPGCGKLLRVPTLASGNTFGAVFWSDGKLEAPMAPETPPATRCSGCGDIFWIEDAARVGAFDAWSRHDTACAEWKQAPVIQALDNAGLVKAIAATPGASAQRLRYLRIALWHCLNDPVRQKPGQAGTDAPQYGAGETELLEQNLGALVPLLDASQPEDRLLMAEAARETGRFSEALELLKDIDPDYAWVAQPIAALAAAGIALVARIPQREWHF